MSCCPSGSLPPKQGTTKITSPEHLLVPQPRGRTIAANGLDIYSAGCPRSKFVVIVLPEVWGIASGRLRNIADQLGDAGYYALLPKIQPNSPFGGWEQDGYGTTSMDENLFIWIDKELNWSKTKMRLQKVLDYTRQIGAERVGVMGFCWSTWATFKASVEFGNLITCGVNCHPSVRLEEWLFKGDQFDLASKVNCPMALFAAGNDPDYVKPGGRFEEILKKKPFGAECIFVDFPDMQHGWVSRGDDSDPVVKRDVEKAIRLAIEFFDKHLKQKDNKRSKL